jgi:hypothetical protein
MGRILIEVFENKMVGRSSPKMDEATGGWKKTA